MDMLLELSRQAQVSPNTAGANQKCKPGYRQDTQMSKSSRISHIKSPLALMEMNTAFNNTMCFEGDNPKNNAGKIGTCYEFVFSKV